uniref:Translation initiation factor IF2/IF5 domain-containing protein n=1 Tax=Octactis speculum TaxID=3111310 RepID=A0A7S2D5T9_9STRA|mmetsp:Transcript_43921/g.59967  ORF Transcript_43921/g.59967 Transcript_43921/m.59967 type:complete len:222 (+) Transcript_43921:85-750(+)
MADVGNEAEPIPEDFEEAMLKEFDLSKKKKKKKKKKPENGAVSVENQGVGTLTGEADGRVYANYAYEELLQRVVDIIHNKNPDLIEKRRTTLKPPQLMRIGTKKTLWANFQDICKSMRRNPEHVFSFFMAELGTEGSIDGNQRLVIRGKYVPKYIESLLRKYIVEYVTCQMCRSPNTTLTRDSVSRLFFMHCQDCGSSRSVAPIRQGFHAQTRADRRAMRK